MSYINDLHRDEIRSGWLVTADAKKVWNRSLEIWAEVDRICRKHNITYWAAGGTLIGAVRHNGFIPWDDDIDLWVTRPDFNRFVAVLKDELAGTVFEVKKNFLSLVQISHSQTTRIDDTYFDGTPQGISLAVIALDIFDDGTPEGFTAINALCESYIATYNYSALEDISRHGGQLFNDLAFLKTVSEIPDNADKVKFFWIFAEQLFKQSDAISSFEVMLNNAAKPFRKEWFAETIYLPFETVELPVPKMFDEVLTAYFGDWRTPVKFDQQHMGYIHSADIPWREFLQRVDVKKLLPPDEEA
ncbi:MAG: LicD family protein [Selenomonadaceae bacterium]|nr:LicD family protein [Selenomonadaceae bacterium]